MSTPGPNDRTRRHGFGHGVLGPSTNAGDCGDDRRPRGRLASVQTLERRDFETRQHILQRDEEAATAISEYRAVSADMRAILPDLIAQWLATRQDDLLTRLVEAELDGERLTQEEILGYIQLLLVLGQEKTANLINNAILCFIENPDQLAQLRANPDLLSSAIEEVLR